VPAERERLVGLASKSCSASAAGGRVALATFASVGPAAREKLLLNCWGSTASGARRGGMPRPRPLSPPSYSAGTIGAVRALRAGRGYSGDTRAVDV